MKPWREVVGEPNLRGGRGGLLGPDTSRRTHWWELQLTCGHEVERTVRYSPQPDARRGGTQHRSIRDVLPHPRRVRCEFCQEES